MIQKVSVVIHSLKWEHRIKKTESWNQTLCLFYGSATNQISEKILRSDLTDSYNSDVHSSVDETSTTP